jgi:type VI secretion system protein ImpG
VNSELLPYYERELLFVRQAAADFAADHPDRAAVLHLHRSGCDDPHVERILEGFALIAGRIQHRMDEEFPEITNSLLELLYPHLVRPVPSLATIQLAVDPDLGKQPDGHLVTRGTIAYSRALNNVQCRFRTVYPTRLWPLNVAGASFGNSADIALGLHDHPTRYAMRLEIEVLGDNKLAKLNLGELRFRIGADGAAAHWIYEMLFTKVRRIVLRYLDNAGKPVPSRGAHCTVIPPSSIRPVGFNRDEAMLPFSNTSFQGYRLLQEYFAFPQKFLYFDLAGLDNLIREDGTDRFEILMFVDAPDQPDRAARLEAIIKRDAFQLGCTPAINLFAHVAEPIRLSHTRTEYEVMPDVHSPSAFEVYSVDRVVSVAPNTTAPTEYRSFYSFRHSFEDSRGKQPQAFWFGTRRTSRRPGDAGTDYFLSFVDRNFSTTQPAQEAVTAQLTCSNRDLPLQLGFDGSWGELDLETGALVHTRVLSGPTPVHRSETSGGLQWRLVSHLALNHLSLVEGGIEALREILRLYNPAETHASTGQIEGLTSVRSSRKVAHLDSQHGMVFCQGLAIDLEMDESRFTGAGAFLLASILERFFGLYCSVNSFTQLRVSTQQRKGIVWQWPIRSGEQAVA